MTQTDGGGGVSRQRQGQPAAIVALRMAGREVERAPLPCGLRDQPHGLLDKMAHAADVYRIVRRFWTAKNIAEMAERDHDGYTAFAKIERMLRDNGYF